MPLSNTPIFTPEQVDSINGYQSCGFWHPFTCGKDHDGERVLVAIDRGMKCPTCDYTQAWVHGNMANGEWKSMAFAWGAQNGHG